jgi:hypothetical protein
MGLYKKFSAPIGTPGNALLNWERCSAAGILSYGWSYRCAAFNLVALQKKNEHGSIDNHALPILFLYRHSFELYLKALVYRAALISIDENELAQAIPKLWREHSLLKLAQMSAPLLEAKSLACFADVHDNVIALAEELDEIDPGSYSFRYPVTSKGKSALPPNFLTNIFVFADTVEDVLDELREYCHWVEGVRVESSHQMKFALHHLRGHES